MNTQTYDYASILKLSERAAWKLEEVIREDAAVDMSRPFLPESVFRAEALAGLTPAERLTFNQITGHSYCHLFIMIEEYVVIDALGKAMSRVAGEREAVRAWIRLSDDEAKHQMMFLRFQRAVARQFPCGLKTLPGVHELAQQILKHSPLGLMVFLLHMELATLTHYTEAIRDQQGLEPLFVNLLKHHWQEESHHIKLDTLGVLELAAKASTAEVDQAIEEYFGLLNAVSMMVIGPQARLDIETFEEATGRTLTEPQREAILAAPPNRVVFIEQAARNPRFLEVLTSLKPEAKQRALALTPTA